MVPVTQADLDVLATLVTGASGSIGDKTFSRNRYGAFVRDRVTPVWPPSFKRARVQRDMVYMMLLYRTALQPEQRAGWEAYAENTDWTNRLGQRRKLQPMLHFVRCTLPRRYARLPIVLDPPTGYGIPDVPSHAWKIKADPVSCKLKITISHNPAWVPPPGHRLYVHATAKYGAAVNSFQPPIVFLDQWDPRFAPYKQFALTFSAVAGECVFAGLRHQTPDQRTSRMYRQRVEVQP